LNRLAKNLTRGRFYMLEWAYALEYVACFEIESSMLEQASENPDARRIFVFLQE
jgi:hypothetical protein